MGSVEWGEHVGGYRYLQMVANLAHVLHYLMTPLGLLLEGTRGHLRFEAGDCRRKIGD